ncbi:hypothetical protein JCM5296_007440 [Sporobolomyces johnsonii]
MDDYFAFQPVGIHSDDLASLADALPTPAAAAGYLSPIDSPSPTFPDPDPETPRAYEQEKPEGQEKQGGQEKVEGAREKPTLSPSELVTVLGRDEAPPPPVQSRFLHGGPPLSELEAPSVVIPNSEKRETPVANSEWRAFTDDEEARLQSGLRKLRLEKEKNKGKAPAAKVVEEKDGTKRLAEDATVDDQEDPPHLVPVGLDNLFTVDLVSKILYPAFWSGSPVRLILSDWFYAPPSVSPSSSSLPSHQLKPYPVDPSLSAALDRAYSTIRPWDSSYDAELESALKGGADAQQRLCVPLGVENESGADTSDLGIEVIFEGADKGRVYSKGMIGSVSKSFWSSGKTLGGGQVVLRGWDAFRRYLASEADKKKKPRTQLSAVAGDHASDSDSDVAGTSSRAPRARTASTSSVPGGQRSASPAPGFFSSLKSRFVGAPASDGEGSEEERANRINETQQALEGPRKEDAAKGEGQRAAIGEVDELVLVIHGIGQQLARTYESFNFTLAVNQFRSACTTLSTSPALSPLLNGKRAQFIPVLWRAELDFDAVDDSADSADEHLVNHFSVQDIEIPGVPFLRQIVSGLVLDVPFYLSPAHKKKMVAAVVRESNRIYRLFCKRNPGFTGRVSIIAHSLGSCIAADILSAQPSSVAKAPTAGTTLQAEPEKDSTFCFDTRVAFLVGSPLAFFLHLGKGQLIARHGRERTKRVARDIALDRAGRYGCLSVDSIYNVYHEADPVAFALNPCVDVRYSKIIKPVPIPSSNQTLLQNLSDAYNRVSRVFDFSSLWSSAPASTPEPKQTGEQAKEQAKAQAKEVADKLEDRKPRPPGLKRMPSERPKFGMGRDEFEWVARAEKRMKALNPSGTIDFVLPGEGLNQYLDAITAHQDYWQDKRFSTFVLTQLFSSEQDLERAGRDEIGEAEEEE